MIRQDRVLAVALLAYFISCCAGSTSKNVFRGQLTPMDADVCTTQNITFTSELLQTSLPNFSIGFAVKDRNTEYVTVHRDNVTEVHETMSQFTVHNITMDTEDISEPVYFYVKSYYWKEFGDKDGSLQLGETSSTRVYPLLETVHDFKCIVINYESMNCSWDYGKYYGENMPEVIFQWRTPSYTASWTDCNDLNINYGYCYWKNTFAGYFKNVNITVRITLKHKCDLNISTHFNIDTTKIVKPNPVSSISSKVINSTCIQLFWNSTNSQPQNHKEHRIIVSSQWDYTTMKFNTSKTTEQFPHNWTFCNLRPNTEYTFGVSIQPIGLYSGYFSDETKIVSRTYSDIPSASPEAIEGGYNSDYRECNDRSQKRRVCIFWKSITEEHKNGPMKGVQGLFTAINAYVPSHQEDWAEDSTYGCSFLLCNTSYNFNIKARNVNGTSKNGSTITIPSFNPENIPPPFIVESTNTSEVYVSIEQRGGRHTKEYMVVWCRNQNGDCQSGHEVDWKHFPSNTTVAELQTNKSAHNFVYGVSVLNEDGNSGVEWHDCVYLKHKPPKREPQNVVVSAGSVDNTLVVTWDKLTCKSDEPYIAMYNVHYNKLDDIDRKSINVTESEEARVVFMDLQEDQPYVVTVRGITSDGRYGPQSEPQRGIPVNKSLSPTEIVGISMAALVCAVFAGVGLFCIIRMCKTKAKKAIAEAGNITLPEIPDFILNNDLKRQNSNDSGYDLTPPSEKNMNAIHFGYPEYVGPYAYRYALVHHDEAITGYREMTIGHCETIKYHGETTIGCSEIPLGHCEPKKDQGEITFDHGKMTRYQSEPVIGNCKDISQKEETKDHGKRNLGNVETTNGKEILGNGETKDNIAETDVTEPEVICQVSKHPKRLASKSTKESKLTLKIPKPVAFTSPSESVISFSEKHVVTTDSLKEKNIDYVKCNNFNPLQTTGPLSNESIETSATVVDNSSEQVNYELHFPSPRTNYIETSIPDSSKYNRHLRYELHTYPLSSNNTEGSTEFEDNNRGKDDKPYPLDNVFSLINIPCPNEMESFNDSSADDDNELSFTDTQCQQSTCTMSPSSNTKNATPKCSKDYIPHLSCIQNNFVRENSPDSSKTDVSNQTNGYVPHPHTGKEYVPCYTIQSYIPFDELGNIAIQETKMDANASTGSRAIHINIDPGYVLSTQIHEVHKDLKTKFPSDIGYVEQRNIHSGTTVGKQSGLFQGYVDDQFVSALQREKIIAEQETDSNE